MKTIISLSESEVSLLKDMHRNLSSGYIANPSANRYRDSIERKLGKLLEKVAKAKVVVVWQHEEIINES